MTESIWFLKNCTLFETLSDEWLSRIESKSKQRTFQRGDMIYLPADAGESMLLVTEGRVKIYHLTAEGKQAVLALIDPGEVFGELSAIDRTSRDEFSEAMLKTSVVLIPAALVQELMQEQPQVTLEVSRLMGLRRKRMERRLKALLFRSNRERLTHLLVELAGKYGRPGQHGIELNIKLSHQEMANIIGSTRETVTLTLGELASDRLIRIDKRKISIQDMATLAASVDMPVPPVMPMNSQAANPRPS